MGSYFAIDEIKSVAYVSPEAGPFAKTGGLGDVAGELPQALALLGIKTYIFTIGYNSILEKYNLDDTGLVVNVLIDFREVPVKILSKQEKNVTYYFLVAQPYTDAPYQGDKLHLTILLSEGTLKAIEVLVNQGLIPTPQIIHANDWQTGLIPVFIKTKYDKHPLFSKTATVLTIHSQGHRADWIPGSRFPELGIGGEHWFGLVQRDDPNHFCILRGAIFHADKLNAVSKTNRDELLTDQHGGILADDLRARADDLVGIMNGVDYDVWKPVKIEDKPTEKSRLQESYEFDVDQGIPLIGMVSRIAEQKNVKLVVQVIRDLLIEGEKIQFVFLGKGDDNDSYNHETLDLMKGLESDWLKNTKFIHKYTTEEQKKVFAGIDLFLYPSVYEPCGTKPIVALINGVPGVVRKTGGLADNFTEYDKNTGEGNGFVFEIDNYEELHAAVKRALELFKDKGRWQKIVKNAQNQDRSWKYPAMEYVELYKQAFQKKASYSDFVKPFGHSNKFIRYGDLEGTFDDSLECGLDLSGNVSPLYNNASLAELLKEALGFLRSLPSLDGNKRLDQNSHASGIVIKVSDNLPNDAGSYYNGDTREILFSRSFINDVLNSSQRKAKIMLAIRLYHELGHIHNNSFYDYLGEEYELIKDDVELYKIISKEYPNEFGSFYPKSYKDIMEGLTDPLIKDFDDVVKAIDKMEEEAGKVYRSDHDIENPRTLVERSNRIQYAFDVADPESRSSKLSTRLKEQTFFRGTFLENYLTILGHRGVRCGRESFFFLKGNEEVPVIHFEQLKNPRVGNKENGRWARQYYAWHDLLYMSDGLAFTEAENGRGFQQTFHEHESQEQTISLCNNTQLRYAHHKLPDGIKTRIEAKQIIIMGNPEQTTKEFVDEGEDKDKEVYTDTRTGKKYVIYDKDVPFAAIISMPEHTFHTLNNTSEKVPSIDFTIKDPITQLIKNYVASSGLKEPKVEGAKKKKNDKLESYQLGSIYQHSYGTYNKYMRTNETDGKNQMIYESKEDNEPKPAMYDEVDLDIEIVVVNPRRLAGEFNFSPLYDEMQLIRIFPWPANIPEDDKVENSIDADKHKWVLDRDFDKIKAKFYVIFKDGSSSEPVSVSGGDIVFLKAEIKSQGGQLKETKSFIIKNESENNFKLMFFTLLKKVEKSSEVKEPKDTILDIKDIIM
jgi:starch synthase